MRFTGTHSSNSSPSAILPKCAAKLSKRLRFIVTCFLVFLGLHPAYSQITQTPDPLSFYPHSAGNVWQYRDASTNKIVYTSYHDSISIGTDSSIFIRGRAVSEVGVRIIYERIDTSFNLYSLTFQPDYPRYKLGADSGDSWQAGFIPPDDTLRVTVTDVYHGFVFGVFTTIKVFTFAIVRPLPEPPFWLGDDHLAVGFGLVFSFIEGGSAPYLAGAIIDSVQWGTIVSVPDQQRFPTFITLHQNYPNPFNPVTTIVYELPTATHVRLRLFDIVGRSVYFYRLEADGAVITKNMIIQK